MSSYYKAPNAHTPELVANRWREEDRALWSYVEARVPAVLDHTGSSSFDRHLRGVQAVLRRWGSPRHLTDAGLFHSIYGTEAFQGFSLPLDERGAIRDLIGDRAERLCWIFCMVDRYTVDETVFAWNSTAARGGIEEGAGSAGGRDYAFRARPELGRFDIRLRDREEWLDFIELSLADWLEQVEGAAEAPLARFHWRNEGEAYAFKRTSFRGMARILEAERPARLGPGGSGVHAGAMLDDVMAQEPAGTRGLEQRRTPPMSGAAAAALEALRSAGEDIREEDFFPRPVPASPVALPPLACEMGGGRQCDRPDTGYRVP